MEISNYLDLITSQHKTKPRFMDWLSSAVGVVNDNAIMTNGMPSNFDIDIAVGIQLDLLGIFIGRTRLLKFQPASGSPVLDDTNYRLALKAKIAQNQWDGTITQIYKVWDSLFPTIPLIIIDNQDMTMSALVDGSLSAIATELIVAGYIIPKPMGVKLSIIGSTTISGNDYLGTVVSELETINLIAP